MASPVFLGLDFGTESVRALLVDAKGNEIGLATSPFPHGQIIDPLFKTLETGYRRLPKPRVQHCERPISRGMPW